MGVAKLLYKAGANMDHATNTGGIPLNIAPKNQHVEVAKLLCEAGANKDQGRA